jgi:uncharacterized cupin superfamily protein
MVKSTIVLKDVKDIPVISPPNSSGIYIKTLLNNTNSKSMRAGIMAFGPGAKSPTQPHYHSVEELQMILHGHGTLTDCSGTQYPLKPGTMILCPPGMEGGHEIANTSDFPLEMLFIYPRQEIKTEKFVPGPDNKCQSKIVMRDLEDLPAEPHRDPNVMVKLLCHGGNAQHLLAGIAWCDPDKTSYSLKPHYHDLEEFQFMLYGSAKLIDCNKEQHAISEGMMYHCPAGAGGTHGSQNFSDFPMCFLFAYPEQKSEVIPA